jgi:hypothetical protein
MLLIWRAVEVNPLGPVQLHDPPLIGCGPMSTTVVVEATVAVVSCVQVEPPFTEIYGTIAVGVQVLLVTVSEMVVVAVRLPEVPVIVTVDVPVVAVLLAVNVTTLDPVVGLVPNAAVTSLGRPVAARVTEPVNGLTSVTVIVSVPDAPWAIDRVDAERESEKLPVPVEVTVTAIEVVAEVVPEIPVTEMVAVPVAVLLAFSVSVSPLTETVTPEFELLAVRVTVPVKPPLSVTMMASVALPPWASVSEAEAGVSVKPPLLDPASTG